MQAHVNKHMHTQTVRHKHMQKQTHSHTHRETHTQRNTHTQSHTHSHTHLLTQSHTHTCTRTIANSIFPKVTQRQRINFESYWQILTGLMTPAIPEFPET